MGGWTLSHAQRAAMERLEEPEGRLAQYGDEAMAIAAGEFPRNARPTAYVQGLIVKAGAGTLYGFSGYSSRATGQFVQVFDLASYDLLATGAVPEVIVTVPAASNFSYDAGTHGRRFLRGIVIANSSTGATYTAGSADTWYDVQFV